MEFRHVATVFDEIEQESSRTEITKLLAKLFADATPTEIDIICNVSLGKLRPSYKGTQFNLAKKSMIQVVAALLDLSEDEVKIQLKKLGDLGAVVDALYVRRPREQLSVKEVYKALCAIEKMSGTGSHEEKEDAVLALLKELDPVSAKYVVRIILGTLRLGFSDMTIVDALSWMEAGDKSLRGRIEDAYNNCADIGLIAARLKKDGIQAIDETHIQVGVPVRPAAAERMPTAQAIIDKIGSCVAQPKLDGFRLQIHIDKTGSKPKIWFYSRNLIDMSYMFPDVVKALEDLPVTSLIAEGEAIAYDPHTGTFLPFQETVKRKRKHDIDEVASEFPLRIYLFDLLYLDGKEYLTATHEERRKKLLSLVKGLKTDRVQVIEEKKIDSAQELQTYFMHQIDTGLEGLVVKKPDSTYQPGKRNFNWIKFKRHEEGELEDTLDCVILGYYAGSGKRASFGIGAFLVGVYNKSEDAFQTVAKIGTGLKDEGWKELRKKCDAIRVVNKPKNVQCAKELYPDVWVSPDIVCMIRADEITLSPLHTAGKTEKHLGYALRFPRFMGYRPDKSSNETTTVKELKKLYTDQFAKKS